MSVRLSGGHLPRGSRRGPARDEERSAEEKEIKNEKQKIFGFLFVDDGSGGMDSSQCSGGG